MSKSQSRFGTSTIKRPPTGLTTRTAGIPPVVAQENHRRVAASEASMVRNITPSTTTDEETIEMQRTAEFELKQRENSADDHTALFS